MLSWFNKKKNQEQESASVAAHETPSVPNAVAPAPEAFASKPVSQKLAPTVSATPIKTSVGQVTATQDAMKIASTLLKSSQLESDKKPAKLNQSEVNSSSSADVKANPKVVYRKLLAGMYDAVIITDPSGHVIETNGRVKELFMFDTDSLWDAPVSKFIRGITPQLLDKLRVNVASSRHVLLDCTCSRADESTFSAEVAIGGIQLLHPGDLVFTIRNTDKRRAVMAKLRSFKNVVDILPDPVAITDNNGVVVYANKSFLDIVSQHAGAVVNRHVKEFFNGDTAAMLEAVASGGKFGGMLALVCPEGAVPVRVIVSPDGAGSSANSGSILLLKRA